MKLGILMPLWLLRGLLRLLETIQVGGREGTMRLGDMLVRSLNEHPVLAVFVALAVLAVLHAAAHVMHGDK